VLTALSLALESVRVQAQGPSTHRLPMLRGALSCARNSARALRRNSLRARYLASPSPFRCPFSIRTLFGINRHWLTACASLERWRPMRASARGWARDAGCGGGCLAEIKSEGRNRAPLERSAGYKKSRTSSKHWESSRILSSCCRPLVPAAAPPGELRP
jgi:hypothetical protein